MSERPFRAAIVDDEPASREAIATLLEGEPRIQVVAVASDGREAVEVVRRTRPDLLFLDVQMPDLDGFQVLEALGPDVPRGVVFVTAHDEHALRAFEVHALDYLMKPFGAPRFRAAASRAIERLRALEALTHVRAHAARETATPPRNAEAGVLDAVAETGRGTPSAEPESAPKRPRRLGVRHGAKTTVIGIADVDWVEASGDYLRLHCGQSSYLITESMQSLEALLDPAEFVRIHRSILVNQRRIVELQREPDGSGSVLIEGGVRLRVARSRWDALQSGLGLVRM